MMYGTNTFPHECVLLQVEFLLLGLIPGHVGLRGRLKEVDGNRDTVKVCTLIVA